MTTTIILLIGITATILLYQIIKKKNKDASPYSIIKKQLEDSLIEADFSNEWEKRQEINLKLIWLKTIAEVESNHSIDKKNEIDKESLISNLSLSDIKFPKKWNLDDFYCFPFSQLILSAYGNVLEKNSYEGMFKPNSILPVPKEIIRKAIYFNFDYLNLKEPKYKVSDKDKIAENLNTIRTMLELWFINTGSEELPKTGMENYEIGSKLKNIQEPYNEVEDFNLIDWRTETNWLGRGIKYADKEQYDLAFGCFNQVKKINPESKDLLAVLGVTYMAIGEHYFEKGEENLAIENMKSAANLNNEVAISWLRDRNIS